MTYVFVITKVNNNMNIPGPNMATFEDTCNYPKRIGTREPGGLNTPPESQTWCMFKKLLTFFISTCLLQLFAHFSNILKTTDKLYEPDRTH